VQVDAIRFYIYFQGRTRAAGLVYPHLNSLRTMLYILAVVAINVEMRGKKDRHPLAPIISPEASEIELLRQHHNPIITSIEVLEYIPILILFEPERNVVSREGIDHISIS
jgi:hypothetical protein